MSFDNTDSVAAAAKIRTSFRLPDPPERHPDDMTSFKHLAATGHAHHLAMRLGNPETTIVTGERYLVVRPTRNMAGSHYPDLLVAFGVDPTLYEANNGYIISEQGKPPDFALEIASPATGRIDVGEKRHDYAAIGIGEYWRFDETGQHHGTRLAGDRLEDGQYLPVDINEVAEGVLQGYSPALNLLLRWTNGTLGWHDPDTGLHIATFESEQVRADQEWAGRMEERAGRMEERAARILAEAQVRALQEQLRRLRSD